MSYYNQFSVNTAIGQIARDNFLTTSEKNDMIRVLNMSSAQSSNPVSGLLSTRDVVRGAIGAGVGSIAAKYIGTVVGGAFGGLSPSTLNRVQNAGAVAGMLRGSGIWR